MSDQKDEAPTLTVISCSYRDNAPKMRAACIKAAGSEPLVTERVNHPTTNGTERETIHRFNVEGNGAALSAALAKIPGVKVL